MWIFRKVANIKWSDRIDSKGVCQITVFCPHKETNFNKKSKAKDADEDPLVNKKTV